MSLLSKDYLQLKQFKLFLQKHESIQIDAIEKNKVGQMMLNNKFFQDFDEDGHITFADYNIAWNWLMQGKPTNINELEEFEPVTKILPYESVQTGEQHILLDNTNRVESKKTTATTTSTKPRVVFNSKNKKKENVIEPMCVVAEPTASSAQKSTIPRKVIASSVSEPVTETNLQVQQADYVELQKVKKFLEKHTKIKITELHQENVSQLLLNNKFFCDFDNDGEITFADYNLAWNWLMQGKPTSLTEFAQNAPDNMKTSDIPYQRVQDSSEHILIQHQQNLVKENASEIKRNVNEFKPKLSFTKKITEPSPSPMVNTYGNSWNTNYFGTERRLISSFSLPTTEPEKNTLKILSADYIELEEMRSFLANKNKLNVNDVKKTEVGQSLVNNKFFQDFDMDGEITFSDYNIAWNWVMQGKPTDIVKFAKSKSATPDTHRIPYQSAQDGDFNVLADNRIIVYERGEENADNAKLISGLGLGLDTGVQIISTGLEEETSDYNEDGEIDEIDLQILECYIMSRPSDICEYNRDRGECPEATKLPNMLTAKFACDTSYYYGDVHLPGDDLIQNEDVEYYMDWLLGDEQFPDVNSLRFILSNNWIETPYRGPGFREVLRDCNIRDQKTEKSLHSTSIYRVDYRDYLIMKEWLRLGKPNFKGKQSDYDALTWFNANSAEGTPIACKLPFEVYMDIGTSCYTFEDTYAGVENL